MKTSGTRSARPRHAAWATALTLALPCVACAPIDVRSEVSVEPRTGPAIEFGADQLISRDFVADYVQIGPRVLIELREHSSCASVRHEPVLRSEHIHRSTHGFVIWDFVLGGFTGGFAALAFAKPELFSTRLIDGQGRELYDNSGAYIVGGVFATVSAALLTAGIVDAIRSRDTSRYADAYTVELGPARPCHDEGALIVARSVRLRIGEADPLDGQTDERGRVRFELPAEWSDTPPETGEVIAVLEIGRGDGPTFEDRALSLTLRVPFPDMGAVHSGVADTRMPPPSPSQTTPAAPVEGPRPPDMDPDPDSDPDPGPDPDPDQAPSADETAADD